MDSSALVEKDEQNNESSPAPAVGYFQPLTGIKDTFGRVGTVFRRTWLALLIPSATAIFIWYVAAMGVRYGMTRWTHHYQSWETLEINGVQYGFKTDTLRVTISRVGLCIEFLLIYLLYCPADAMNLKTIGQLYAAEGETPTNVQLVRNLALPKPALTLLTVLAACFLWCLALLLPLAGIILWMAPEGQLYRSGIESLYLPLWPKLVGGTLYLIYSTIFMLATYYIYPTILFQKGGVLASFGQSKQLVSSHWKHMTWVLVVWFIIKLVITKLVTMLNMMYYQHEFDVWLAWDILGIPLHPIRVLYSTMDLWEVGRSWISVPFVIGFAIFGSVFQAVLYFDGRVKYGSYTAQTLREELGGDESTAPPTTTPYKTMDEEEPAAAKNDDEKSTTEPEVV